jgi:pantothenate kinase
VARARALVGPGHRRVLLGVTGPPGAGKSTLATALEEALGPSAAVVGMDGFHLANVELRRLGRIDRKGAPDTFDPDGYVALLGRLRHHPERRHYAPAYDRTIEEAVAGAVPVDPHVTLVITEGNYLLVEQPPWDQVGALLDEVWYCELDDSVRTARLLERHRRYGKSEEEARRFVSGNDAPNARLVERTRPLADLIVEGS